MACKVNTRKGTTDFGNDSTNIFSTIAQHRDAMNGVQTVDYSYGIVIVVVRCGGSVRRRYKCMPIPFKFEWYRHSYTYVPFKFELYTA